MKKDVPEVTVVVEKKKRGAMKTWDKVEIEEEANTQVNNGMPTLKTYDAIYSQRVAPLFLIQLQNRVQSKRGEKCNQYKIDVYMNAVQIFYNRILISRAQTFVNNARINRV